MSLIEAIVLGVVQGLTEFLPISSSGHLRIVPALCGWDDPGAAFTAVIQLGTMTAVLIYFRRQIWEITTGVLRTLAGRGHAGDEGHARLGVWLAVGTLPIVVFGVIFKDQIETGARSLYLIAAALFLGAVVIGVIDATAKLLRGIDSLKLPDVLVVGLAQSLALIPGVSRSGATITGALLRDFKRADAARFSFLLSIPAVVLSGLYELKDAVGQSTGAGTLALVVATLAAFASGYWSIAFLLRWLGRHTMAIFVGYRLVLGTLVLVLTASGLIS